MESTITQNWKKALTLAAKEASSVHVIADSNLPEEYSFEVLELCKAVSRTQIINFKGEKMLKPYLRFLKFIYILINLEQTEKAWSFV